MKKLKEIIKSMTIWQKIWIVAAIAICISGCVFLNADPIVVSIEQNESIEVPHPGKVYSFYDDGEARYYLASGELPWDVTVHYLNQGEETLVEAINTGHITLDDLDRFGIEYLVKYKNQSYWR
jgi:hypothetical protein